MGLLHFKVSPGLRNDSIVTLAYLWQGWWEASGIRGLRNHSGFQALRSWGRRESVGRAKMGAGLLGVAFFFLFALSQFRGPDYLGTWKRLEKSHH